MYNILSEIKGFFNSPTATYFPTPKTTIPIKNNFCIPPPARVPACISLPQPVSGRGQGSSYLCAYKAPFLAVFLSLLCILSFFRGNKSAVNKKSASIRAIYAIGIRD